jgi:dolichol-phosphate mannosyltransferase
VGDAPDRAGHHLTRPRAPLTVVVPVYNEGANIRLWWEAARPYLPADFKVLVVYDFEEDDTLPVVREMQREGAPFQILKNGGRGALGAMITGLRSATEGPIVVSMADLSDDFTILPRMLAAWQAGADVVVASRYMAGGRQLGGPWLKGQLARWGGRSLRWLAGFPVSDATNSFRLYDARLIGRTVFESSGGFELAFEITVKAWMSGARIVELPATWRDREQGQSRFQLWHLLPRYIRIWVRALLFGLRRRIWM